MGHANLMGISPLKNHARGFDRLAILPCGAATRMLPFSVCPRTTWLRIRGKPRPISAPVIPPAVAPIAAPLNATRIGPVATNSPTPGTVRVPSPIIKPASPPKAPPAPAADERTLRSFVRLDVPKSPGPFHVRVKD